VIALGDSFHDGDGAARLASSDRETLAALQCGRDWFWIAGNHDPAPPMAVGGTPAAALAIGALTFRHLPTLSERSDGESIGDGEIAGHLHPVARVAGRGRTVSRRCFASDGRRVVMPAFGAYAGGLNVHDRAFAEVFGGPMILHVLGESRVYAIAMSRCLPD
jgi:uncharacterized protein